LTKGQGSGVADAFGIGAGTSVSGSTAPSVEGISHKMTLDLRCCPAGGQAIMQIEPNAAEALALVAE
jgi:hypothetical protein